jgi:hypothetical protein
MNLKSIMTMKVINNYSLIYDKQTIPQSTKARRLSNLKARKLSSNL